MSIAPRVLSDSFVHSIIRSLFIFAFHSSSICSFSDKQASNILTFNQLINRLHEFRMAEPNYNWHHFAVVDDDDMKRRKIKSKLTLWILCFKSIDFINRQQIEWFVSVEWRVSSLRVFNVLFISRETKHD